MGQLGQPSDLRVHDQSPHLTWNNSELTYNVDRCLPINFLSAARLLCRMPPVTVIFALEITIIDALFLWGVIDIPLPATPERMWRVISGVTSHELRGDALDSV